MIKPGRSEDYRDRTVGRRAPLSRPETTKHQAIQKRTPTKPTGRYEQLKATVRTWLEDRTKIAAALKEIHDEKLYKNEYPTFEAFCLDEYGISRASAYRLLDTALCSTSETKMSQGETPISNENGHKKPIIARGKQTQPAAPKTPAATPKTIDVEARVLPRHCATCTCGD